MNQPNYQKELEKILSQIEDKNRESKSCEDKNRESGGGGVCPPKLLLHSCCAPCSSYCLEYLGPYFAITVFYYNPNISASDEYWHRLEEQKRLIAAYNAESAAAGGSAESAAEKYDGDGSKCRRNRIEIVEGDYRPQDFFDAVKGYEHCAEGGERCEKCFELRLGKTAELAARGGFDYFCTTLTISPLKNAVLINEIGSRLSEACGVRWLPSDFKKKDGYKRSIELSAEYDLYRQNYCGCVFSKTLL